MKKNPTYSLKTMVFLFDLKGLDAVSRELSGGESQAPPPAHTCL